MCCMHRGDYSWGCLHTDISLTQAMYLRSYMKVNGKVRYWAQLLYSWTKFPFNLNGIEYKRG